MLSIDEVTTGEVKQRGGDQTNVDSVVSSQMQTTMPQMNRHR
jgi:hypothetical protein